MQEVLRILRSAPTQADVQCHDFTDTWSPYLYADRKVRIANLLIQLKKYNEARDELWSLFLREKVIYQGRRRYYTFGKVEAISLLVSRELWQPLDIERRLRDPKYEYVDEI